jgi:peptide/nickel transport system substrate-binding protein
MWRRLIQVAAVLALVTVAAACTGATAKVGLGRAVRGAKVRGGTVTMAASTGASPDDIFPLLPATNGNGLNGDLTMELWPWLVYLGDGPKSIVNPQESPYTSLSYSNHDKVITMVLKPWKWSDGVPVTARDFTFTYNLLKADYNDWSGYIPGLFPVDVAKVQTPNAHTVVLDLIRSYNPTFYTQDVLSTILLMPQQVWDKTSPSGKVGNYDTTTAGAKAVWSFLQKQGADMSTFASNPLWKVVDGPWKLAQFQSDGYYVLVPNKNYSGPDKPVLDKVVYTPFTSENAEIDTLRSGTSLNVASLPLNDISQIPALENDGYAVASVPTAGVAEIVPNLYNSVNGPVLRQLYIRQALEYLINRQKIVSKVYNGYADPGNGPVPVLYAQQWATPLEKAGGPYPYSPAKAVALLKAHGTDSCQKPGSGASDCGAGIAAGQRLQFQLIYTSGSSSVDQQSAEIQSTEAQAGVTIALKPEPYNTINATTGTCNAESHPAAACAWQLLDFGHNIYYAPDASGAGMFNTDADDNYGGYANPEMDRLINATEYGSSPSVFFDYENYAARQLPWLWLPDPSSVYVYKKNLAGVFPSNPFTVTLNPESWYYTRPAS